MARPAKPCKSLLEFLHHRATNEAGGSQRCAKYFGQFLLEFNMRSNEIKKRNGIG
jgi:hypothetical protein